jgi:hypothetical protein
MKRSMRRPKLQVIVAMLGLTLLGSSAYWAGALTFNEGEIKLAGVPVKQCTGSHQIWTNIWVYEGKENRDDYRLFLPNKIGDSITLSITTTNSGRFSLYTGIYKDNAEGIYRLYVNGQRTGPDNDFFTSGKWEHGVFNLQPGTYTITYVCIGKNPKSKGMGVKLDILHFWPAK